MKTKLLVSIVSCLAVVLFLTSFASAINQQTYDQMDFMSKLSYNLRNGLGLFTTWGQSNCCSDNPDKEGALFTNDVVRCTDKCSYNKCAIDIFIQGYNSDGSVNVYKTFEGETTTGSYTNTQVTKKWYQIYCCPSTCGTGFHTTPIYDCLNGQWVSKGGVLKTDPLRWCSDGTQKNYKDQDGNVHCASSPSSAWCPAVTCTPNWQCGSWGNCIGNTQTRTCTDSKNCGVSTNKPTTSRTCSSSCTPSDSCASTTCIGSTCKDICNNVYQGTKDCSIPPPPCIPDNYCASVTCTGETCTNNCGAILQGTKDCVPNQPSCVDNQEIFYSDGFFKVNEKDFGITGWNSVTKTGEFISIADNQYFPAGFTEKYQDNKRTACCSNNLTYEFDSEKSYDYSASGYSIIKDLLCTALLGICKGGSSDKISLSYSTYVCKEKSQTGFCIQVANSWLNPIVHTDDCQTNTIIFIVIVLIGLIALARFMG